MRLLQLIQCVDNKQSRQYAIEQTDAFVVDTLLVIELLCFRALVNLVKIGYVNVNLPHNRIQRHFTSAISYNYYYCITA